MDTVSDNDHRDNTQPNQRSAWPAHAMTYWLSGYLDGIQAGRAAAEAEMAQLWQPAYDTVQAAARTPAHTEHQDAIRARQIASCETQKRAAVPWPDEVNP